MPRHLIIDGKKQEIDENPKILNPQTCVANSTIDYNTMERSQQVGLDYLWSSKKGDIPKRYGDELKKLKIGEKTYNFERGKPISKILNTKFNKIRQTMADYGLQKVWTEREERH